MAATTKKTIILKGRGIRKEREADGAITPGHLVYITSANAVAVHAVAGGNAQKAFAVENDLVGDTISDAYADESRVQYEVMERGAEINALIADGEDIAIGDALESAGDGTLQKHTAADSAAVVEADNAIVAYALEAVDMTSSSAADPSGRCAVEIA